MRGDLHQDDLADHPARAEPVLGVEDRAHQARRGDHPLGHQPGPTLADLGHRRDRLGLAPLDVEDLEPVQDRLRLLGQPADLGLRPDQDRLDPSPVGRHPERLQDRPVGAPRHGHGRIGEVRASARSWSCPKLGRLIAICPSTVDSRPVQFGRRLARNAAIPSWASSRPALSTITAVASHVGRGLVEGQSGRRTPPCRSGRSAGWTPGSRRPTRGRRRRAHRRAPPGSPARASRACWAEIGAPVRSISIAALGGIDRTSGTIGVVQNRPILTPGVEKVAPSAATARSQLATSWQPAASAGPWTRAITGWGSVRSRPITREHRPNSSA